MRRFIGGTLALAAVLVAAGCGDDDGGGAAATTEAPTTDAPSTEAPTTDAPSTEAPTTDAPSTEAPTTEAPTTETPSTETASGGEFPQDYFSDLSGEVVWYDTSSGTTTEYRDQTILANFTDHTGVSTRADYHAGQTMFFAAAEADAPMPWSMIEFGAESELDRAVEMGLVMPLDTSIVPLDKMVDGTYTEYGIEALQYGWNIVWNTDVFPDPATAPRTAADVFDTEKFPGKRCMFQWPGGTYDLALRADGVAPEDLHPLDVDRAKAKLDIIKDDIVWWLTGDESIRYVIDGECDFGMTWSSRVYNAVVQDDAPLAMSWEDSAVNSVFYAVPVGAPNPEAGMALISWWIQDLDGQREFLQLAPLTTPIKALEEEGYPPELAPWLASGENTVNSARPTPESNQWWADNIDSVLEDFNQWIAS